MVTAPQRREGVQTFKTRDVSERRSCDLAGISRSSFRYVEHPRDDGDLAERLKKISNKQKRYGYRRAWAVLRREGEKVNIKRVYRVWKKEGLTLPRRRPRKRRKGTGEVPCKAIRPNHVWTYDFIHDALASGRKLKMLTIVDEFTRFCLKIEPDRSIKATKVVEILKRLFEEHGAPSYIRSDNGPEFIADVIKEYLFETKIKTIYIDPGSPWQNAFEESFHGRFRDECLNMEEFRSIAEARVITEMWRRQYNDERPHSSLNYMTPLEFKEAFEKSEAQTKMSLSHSGLCGWKENERRDSPSSGKPRPSAQSPASALRSLSSVALSSAQANKIIMRRQKISTPSLVGIIT
jgi:putative transposase